LGRLPPTPPATQTKERQVPRGDGRLTHDLDPQEQGPQDECGVFGVWAPGEEVAKLTYFGLYALQHRGQEAAGMAVSDGSGVTVYKDLGLVAQVFDESTLSSLRGHVAVGHARYSTTGGSTWENAQPLLKATEAGTTIALAHNGNLVNTTELAKLAGEGSDGETSDTALVADLLAMHPDLSVEEASMLVLPALRGAFSFVYMDENTLYAARDANGVRPLVLGRLERGWVVASETAALDIVGASMVREIEPGELIAIDEQGLRSQRFAAPDPKGCLFEYVYLARPDTTISGRNVYDTRVEVGRKLAKEHPVDADLVIPVPESGTPAAIGYAQSSGIPYGSGLIKNAYVGRTFIQPSQTIRQLGIRLKLNPLRHVLRGKRVIVVDDSIVRGNTQRAIVRMLREAGAIEVHVRIASPPVKWPCFYGIDFATKAELIAGNLDIDGIRRSIGSDTLGYVSLEGVVAASEQPINRLCRACFDGVYPIALPSDNMIGKHVLEGVGRRVGTGFNGANFPLVGVNGAGVNSAHTNGTNVNSTSGHGIGVNGANVNGANVNGTSINSGGMIEQSTGVDEPAHAASAGAADALTRP
jgi:amidophosphoribosyltransferase